jgi:hypothetical protein
MSRRESLVAAPFDPRFGIKSPQWPASAASADYASFADAVLHRSFAPASSVEGRTADVQAEMLGRNVAEYMAEHYFQPVG